ERIVVTLVAARRPCRETSRLNPAEDASAPLSAGLPEESLEESGRPPSRFVPPPPSLTPQQTEKLLSHQQGGSGRSRKAAARLKQGQLPLEILSKGRFEKSEPTIHRGQDLDVPTYIRRGVALN